VTWPKDSNKLHPAFVDALRASRESFNRRFAQRRYAGAKIDEQAFQEHLQTTVNDLVGCIAAVQQERVQPVLDSLFDASLDLFEAGLLGAEARHPHVIAAWREILPHASRLLAREPARIVGCLSNAADRIATQTSARPDEWTKAMRDLSQHCDSVSQWLNVGKVLAWRVGMVQYRSAALHLARELPCRLSARCFELPDDINEMDWHKQLDKLERDRWFSPLTRAAAPSLALRIVRTTGGFRGFGGPCLRPPTVNASADMLFIADGCETWQLIADAFGTLWYRVRTAPPQCKAVGMASKVTIDRRGRIAWDGICQDFPELAEASSFDCDGQTLAVTVPTSHHVFLVARIAM
jgi:hypothetical protein